MAETSGIAEQIAGSQISAKTSTNLSGHLSVGWTAGPSSELPGEKLTASNADIAEFRSYLGISKQFGRRRLARMRSVAGRRLALPLAISHGLRGVARYGCGVNKRYKAALLDQFRQVCAANFSYRILPENFYLYQLYLPANRGKRNGHFAFSEILSMQQRLIDLMACDDFPWLRSKHRFAERCQQAGLPTVPVLAEFADGKMIRHSSENGLPPSDLFSKPSEYWCGIGANLWVYNSSRTYINAVTGEICDSESLSARLCAESKSGRIVLQKKVSNHPSMADTLTNGGLATVRLVTCRTPSGGIDLLPPVLRMPIGQAIVDNIAQGGLAAPIDIASGRICGPAMQKSKKIGVAWFDKHPDTQIEFANLQLPFWQRVLDLGWQAHSTFPSMPFVGWDIAILRDGPVLLEGNSWWDVDLTFVPHRISAADTQFIPYYNHHWRKASAKAS